MDKQTLAHELWKLGREAMETGYEDVARLIAEAHIALTKDGFGLPKPIESEPATDAEPTADGPNEEPYDEASLCIVAA